VGIEELTAADWSERGADLLEVDLEQAEACYRRALELDASLRWPWFDLGLIHKWRREWAECLACNRKAIELDPWDEQDPAYWNAGIAATALEDWPTARWAWRGYGVPTADGDGPIEEDFGPGVVRLPVGETVWGTRIDPARMALFSIPLPDSGFRYGDIVLHDGEPRGSRVAGGREYSVFDAISRWRPSPVPTVQVVVNAPGRALERLMASFESSLIPAENWTTSMTLHCKACSHGRVDYDSPDHAHAAPAQGDGSTRIGCSGTLVQVGDVVYAWASTEQASMLGIEEVA
jgi:hypothetical protein